MKKFLAFTSIIALALAFAPVASHAAFWSNDVNITTTNSADVVNSFDVSASTGNNTAIGGVGGAPGAGGSVTNSGDTNTGGAGGAGGAGGEGGIIATGDSTSSVAINNTINSTDVTVSSSTLPGDASDNDVNIITSNTATLTNAGTLATHTGNNMADAGSASIVGAVGGGVDASGSNNMGGAGGASGAGGTGGSIITGNSVVSADVVNVVNMTVKRVMR